MSGRRAVLPSGRAGVYRASDGKRWDAYVLDKDDLILLGTYATIRAADAARDEYWKRTMKSQLRTTAPATISTPA
jgi:hypothetical protein